MTPAERVRLELLEEFRKSALERLERISSAWMALEAGSAPAGRPQALLRELHTLKGEAKLMGFAAVSRLIHEVEEVIVRALPDGQQPPPALAELVLAAIDTTVAIVKDASGEAGPAAATVPELISRFDAALRGLTAPPPPAPTPVRAASNPGPRLQPPAAETLRVDAAVARAFAGACADAVVLHARQSHALARAREAGEKLGGLLARRRGDGAADLREAQARLAEALEQLDEHLHEGGAKLRELDADARRLRLVPLAPILRLHARALRDLAREQGKQAALDLRESEVSLDRAVIDRLAEPLLHLIRNCVDHGLEAPAERQAAGKPASGRVTLSAQAAGGDVHIVVEDDGRGIDLDRVRRRAVELALVSPATELSDAEALGLLFASGFTTRTAASETSGRGVGLDVVKRQIESLGGAVRVSSRPGQGTRFELRVPVTVSLTRALILRHGGVRYALPAAAVEAVVDVDPALIASVHTRRTLPFRGERVALCDLAAAVDAAPARPEYVAGGARALVVRHEEQMVAVEVESIEGDAEVVVKPLGGPLARARVVLGACVLGDGELAVALAPSELVSRALGELPRVRAAAARSPRPAAGQRVLIAEDSAITRSMMARLLRMLGYTVAEAEDGERALRSLEEADVDLLITDIEMPNLDGIELITRVRAEARWRRLPVVVLSTRGSDHDKQRAIGAGADAYLVKTEFSESALREVLARHVERA